MVSQAGKYTEKADRDDRRCDGGGLGPRRGEVNREGGPLARLTPDRDVAVVALGDLAAKGQSHARALVLASTVKALKNGKDAINVLLVETDTLITNGYLAHASSVLRICVRPFFDRSDVNDRILARFVVFEGIAEKVLEKLAHLRGVGIHVG